MAVVVAVTLSWDKLLLLTSAVPHVILCSTCMQQPTREPQRIYFLLRNVICVLDEQLLSVHQTILRHLGRNPILLVPPRRLPSLDMFRGDSILRIARIIPPIALRKFKTWNVSLNGSVVFRINGAGLTCICVYGISYICLHSGRPPRLLVGCLNPWRAKSPKPRQDTRSNCRLEIIMPLSCRSKLLSVASHTAGPAVSAGASAV